MASQIEILVKANADGAKQAIGGLTDSIARNRKKIGLALTGIGAGITGLAGLSIKAAQEEAIGISRLDQALKNVGASYDSNKDSIEAVISATQRKTNFGDEEQRDILTKLVTVIGDEEKALAALPAVLDASAASGKSANAVSETMGKFLSGVTNTSDAVGISMDKTAGFTDRLGAVMDKVGGQAEAAADPFTQLKNRTGDLQQEFGKILLPIMEDLAVVLEKVTRKVIDFTEKHPGLTKWLGIAAAALGGLMLVVGPLLLALPGLAIAFSAVGVAINLALGPVGLVVLAVAGVTAGVIILSKNWDKVWNGIKRLTEKVANFVIDMMNKLTLIWRKQAEFILDMVAELVNLGSKLPFVGDKFEDAAISIRGFSDKLGEGIPKIDITSDKTEDMGEAFDEADKKIGTANAGITESTDKMADDVGEALDEITANRISHADLLKEIQIGQTKAAFEEEQKRIQDVKDTFAERVKIAEDETKKISASWEKYRDDNTEIMAALKEAELDFGDVMEELAIRHNMSLDDMAVALEAAKVTQGDLTSLMSSHWASEVDKQLIDAARLTDGLIEEQERASKRRLEIEQAGFSDLERLIKENNAKILEASQTAKLEAVGGLEMIKNALEDGSHIGEGVLEAYLAQFESGEHFNANKPEQTATSENKGSSGTTIADIITAGMNNPNAHVAPNLIQNAALAALRGTGGKFTGYRKGVTMADIEAAMGLANGGIVTRPTLAVVGEAGPEAVVPLSRGRGIGGMNVTVNIGEGAIVGVDNLTDTIAQTVRDTVERGGFRGVF